MNPFLKALVEGLEKQAVWPFKPAKVNHKAPDGKSHAAHYMATWPDPNKRDKDDHDGPYWYDNKNHPVLTGLAHAYSHVMSKPGAKYVHPEDFNMHVLDHHNRGFAEKWNKSHNLTDDGDIWPLSDEIYKMRDLRHLQGHKGALPKFIHELKQKTHRDFSYL